MNSHLGAGKILELLDNLKGTVEDFAARAGRLNDEFRTKSRQGTPALQAALEEQAAQLSRAVAEAEATSIGQGYAEAKYTRRKARIGRAYQSSKEQALKKIEDQAGARKYELQKRMLQAERDRDTGLATTTANFEEFRRNLATEQEGWLS